MNTLNRLAQADTSVDHVFLWEAAIPDNSWDEQTRDYFPMQVNNTQLPYDYNYPHAHKAVQQATVLYSGEDTILGASQSEQADDDTTKPLTTGQLTQQLINDSEVLIANHFLPNWLPHSKPDTKRLKQLNQKVNDPGAGIMFALPNLVLSILDQHGIKGYDNTLPPLSIIYHLANWFLHTNWWQTCVITKVW